MQSSVRGRWAVLAMAIIAGLAVLAAAQLSWGHSAEAEAEASTIGRGGDVADGAAPQTFDCPVTAPNGATPPGEKPSPGHHGNREIWTVLWPEGVVVFEPGGPGSIGADGTLSMKWPWWRSAPGAFEIDGRRLDEPSDSALRADIPDGYGTTGFQVAALIFPSEGCWEVTARVGEESLSFVTRAVVVR